MLPCADVWHMEFACGGHEALKLLESSIFDVIIADMRMPGMDGTALLTEVARLYPQMVRMVLSGTWERGLRVQAAMVAHQYLSKPCDAHVLQLTLERAFALRDVLVEPGLRALISGTASLPSTPAIYHQLLQVLRNDDASAQQIGTLLAEDMAMTAKVLQLVNSAFFGLCREITSPEDAVMFLGIDTVKALALSVSAFSCFSASQCPQFSIDDLQRHSSLVASAAREIAKSQKASKSFLDETFVAGLLHDVGQLVLVSNHAEKYAQVLSAKACENRTLEVAEREVFGTTHAEVGGYLLWLWGLPNPIVEAVAFHHSPSQSPSGEFAPLSAVYVADALERAHASGIAAADACLDIEYLTRIGAADAVSDWYSIVRQQPVREKT